MWSFLKAGVDSGVMNLPEVNVDGAKPCRQEVDGDAYEWTGGVQSLHMSEADKGYRVKKGSRWYVCTIYDQQPSQLWARDKSILNQLQ